MKPNMCRSIVVVCMTVLWACGTNDGDQPVVLEEQRSRALLSIDNIVEHAVATPQFGCGTKADVANPNEIVAITEDQCLSCKGIGFLLRSLTVDIQQNDMSIWVVAPVEEAEAICSFLEIERVRTPVALVPRQYFPDRAQRRWVLYATIDSHGRPFHKMAADNVDDILTERNARFELSVNVGTP